jgi:hypothetical protein
MCDSEATVVRLHEYFGPRRNDCSRLGLFSIIQKERKKFQDLALPVSSKIPQGVGDHKSFLSIFF